VPLARLVSAECPRLLLRGLMTIGPLEPRPDSRHFEQLAECRAAVARELRVEEASLELSMGMSGDYEEAIRKGSSIVRLGSTIFGARPPKPAPEQQQQQQQ
jgi:uncharacterized pyridoxal phosphate-containing UPF0001 family protein